MEYGNLNPTKINEDFNEKRIEALRSFCSNKASINKDSLIIRENGEIVFNIPIKDLYITLERRMDTFYNKFIVEIDKLKEQGYDMNEYVDIYNISTEHSEFKLDVGYSYFTCMMLTYQKSRDKLKSNTKAYFDFNKKIVSYIEEIKKRINKYDFSIYVYNAVMIGLTDPKAIESIFNKDTTYSIDEAVSLVKEFAEKDTYNVCRDFECENILVAPTGFLRKLEKIGYIEPKRDINYSPNNIKECDKDLNYEERFLSTKSCVSAYYYGLIDLEHLKRNFVVADLFDEKFLVKTDDLTLISSKGKNISFLDNEDEEIDYKEHGKMLMEIIDEVNPETTYPVGFWNYYINDILSIEDMKKLIEEGFIDVKEVLTKFLRTHKLAQELEENNEEKKNENINKPKKEIDYIFDEDKTYKLFNSDIMIYYYSSKNIEYIKDIHREYIHKYLKKYYQKNGKDISYEFMKSALNVFEEYKFNEDLKADMLKRLYNDNIIHASDLKNEKISNSVIELLIEQEKDNNSAIIDLYNNNLIEQDKILEEFDEKKVLDLINEGMNINVIVGFYSSNEIIDMLINENKDKKITRICDLSFLRNEINIEKIKQMYQPLRINTMELDKSSSIIDKLTYDNLNTLVTYGILTEEEADEIDQEYDYKLKIDMLIENGLIVGDINGAKVDRNEGEGTQIKNSNYGPGKMDDNDKQSLYLALDDEYIELTLASVVLKNYNLVIMPKLKIAIMEPNDEGEGASYIMSIKLALDQISNNQINTEEKKEDPLKAYRNRTGIRSIPSMETANHVENWGYNIVKKMKKIHPNIESLMYSKDDEKQKELHRNNIIKLQQRIFDRYLETKIENKKLIK